MNAAVLEKRRAATCDDCAEPTGDILRGLCEECAAEREQDLDGSTVCRMCLFGTGDLSAHFCAECATTENVCNGCGDTPDPSFDVGAPICAECYFSP